MSFQQIRTPKEDHRLIPEFRIKSYRKFANLYIGLNGKFDARCAWALLKIIKNQKAGYGRVFVQTKGLQNITPSGTDLLKSHLSQENLPKDWLYFKGARGFEIAPNGARVLVCNKPCKGRKAPTPLQRSVLAAGRPLQPVFITQQNSKGEYHEKGDDYLRQHDGQHGRNGGHNQGSPRGI